jgi:hypothetical protein
MTFQEIDFHIELFKAYLQPPGANFAYLDIVKKKSGYPKDAFLAKLDQAYNNIEEAWQIEHDLKTFRLIGSLKDLALPISMFNRYPVLFNFSMAFQGHINKVLLENLSQMILVYKTQYRIKKIGKLINSKVGEVERDDEFDSNSSKKSLESIWRQGPKFSIDKVLEFGIRHSLWNEKFQLIAKKNSLFASGKRLLASLYVFLKENESIRKDIHYKEAGEILCVFFSVKIGNAKEPFKQFEAGNTQAIIEFRKLLK